MVREQTKGIVLGEGILFINLSSFVPKPGLLTHRLYIGSVAYDALIRMVPSYRKYSLGFSTEHLSVLNMLTSFVL